MTDLQVGLTGFALLFALLAVRMPIGTAMLVVGTGGIYLINPNAALPTLAGEAFNVATTYTLSILPLFVLMGNLAGVSGMSRDLYDAAYSWFGHNRGGLVSSTIIGCGAFSALSGSSLASAVTVGRVALPEMQRYGYDNRLATGAIAAGGTLGILIPPSAGFLVYALLTEESIARLFLAGVIPGILMCGLFILATRLVIHWKPELVPTAARLLPWRARLRALRRAVPIFSIIVITIGGIYVGAFSAVESAGIGAFLAFVVSLYRKTLTWSTMKDVLRGTLQSTATIFYILIGAFVITPFVALSGIPTAVADILLSISGEKYFVLLTALAMCILLGTFLEGFAILVLTIPILQPIMESYGVDMIWFGVLMVIVLEMGLISPPVGINVFVVKGIAPDVPISDIYRGIWPFWVAMLVAIMILLIFPDIALLLPNTMYG
jgi:tripartite ATP-independent transporter DctM subunit